MDDGERTADAVVWRRLGPTLWVGRDDRRCIGTIERGRRFTWIDPDGGRHPGHPTLHDAQHAARSAAPEPRVPWYDCGSGALAIFWTISAAVVAVLWVTGVLLLL